MQTEMEVEQNDLPVDDVDDVDEEEQVEEEPEPMMSADIELNSGAFYNQLANDPFAWNLIADDVKNDLMTEMREIYASGDMSKSPFSVLKRHYKKVEAEQEAQNAEVNVSEQGQEESDAEKEEV